MSLEWSFVKGVVDGIPGFLTLGQDRALFDLACGVPAGGVIVEIGSFKGKSSACLAGGCVGEGKRLFCVDPFCRQPTDEYSDSIWDYDLGVFRKNVEAFGDVVVPVQGLSQDVGLRFGDVLGGVGMDLLFVDGAHTFEGAFGDFRLFFPFLKLGGWFALHDVAEGSPWAGVLRVWQEFALPCLDDVFFVDSLAVGRKVREFVV